MTDGEFDVPVALIMFNRPDHTRAVFDRIAAIRPKQLFVIADGPRPDRPDDAPKCKESRAVLDRVDWDCDLRTNFSATNLGCGQRICTALDWVFDQVDRAILLEDDCVPDPSFFHFCAELLEIYKDDLRVRTISGSNFLFGKARTNWSYYFSSFHFSWGWATWRRSWQKVDQAMKHWPEVRDDGWLVDIVGNDRTAAKFWMSRFDATFQGRIRSSSYPYLFSCWLDHSLAVNPNRNLVNNIGSGYSATHTRKAASYLNCPTEPIRFPLTHPPFMICDRVADREAFRRRMLPEQDRLLRRVARRIYYFATNKKRRPPTKVAQGRLVPRHVDGQDLGSPASLSLRC